MLKIGLTGGIATGKSFVLNIFSKEGFFTAKADEIAKKLYTENKKLKEKLIKNFGSELYQKDKINLKKVEEILFNEPEERKKFEKIYYPEFEIFQNNFFRELSKKHKTIVYESALLFEVGTHKKFDILILTYCKRETQVKRALERGISKEKIEKILEHQISYEKILNKVDFSLNTDKPVEKTEKEVLEIINRIKRNNF